MHCFRLLVACTLLTSAALAAPLPQAADPAAAPSAAADGTTPTTPFDPSSFASGPDSSFASGAGPDGANEESTPAITKDSDPVTSGNSSSPGLPDVGADDFGNINGLLSGLSGLQANAGTSNGDDKDTSAALGSLTGTAAQPTGEGQDAALEGKVDSATPVGLVAAAMTGSAFSGSSTVEPSSTDSAATAVAAVTPAPTLSPTAVADTNSTMASTNGTDDAAAAASSNLTFDLAGFLSGAEFDPAATAPAGAIAAAAATTSA